MQKRWEKGLCFKCDEKFIPGHRYKVKQAFLIDPSESSEEEERELPTELNNAEVSIHAMTDIQGPRTMKIGSWIKTRRVIVLVDNGSTHNFINQDTAKKLS